MDIKKSKKNVQNIDYEAVFKEYMTTDKSVEEIAKKFGLGIISEEKLELMVKQFAESLDAEGFKSPDKKTFLSKYYEKRRKRKEKKAREKKKTQDEENERLRKEQDDKKEQEKLEEAKVVLRAYTSFDLGLYDYLNRSKMSKKYFDKMFYILESDNSKDSNKLYREVKSKLYEDYLNDKNPETDKIDEKEFLEKVKEAKYIASSYISSNADKIAFCKGLNIPTKYFDKVIYTLKYDEPSLYDNVLSKTAVDGIKKSALLPKFIKKVGEKIEKGVKTSVNTTREFELLDYYKLTEIKLENLFVLAKEYDMQKETILIEEFLNETKSERGNLDFSKEVLSAKTDEEKELLINVKEYMIKNNIPLLNGTFEKVKENFVSSKNEQAEEITRPVDDLVLAELMSNDKSLDFKEALEENLFIPKDDEKIKKR